MRYITIIRRYRFVLLALISVIALLVTACSADSIGIGGSTTTGGSTTGGGGSGTTGECTSASQPDCAPGSGIPNAVLSVEPDAGDTPIVQAIQGAQHSIELEVYILSTSEHHIVNALEDAANRGVNVQVMLEPSVNSSQFIDQLNSAGVKAKTTNPKFRLTHAKTMVIDGQTAYISTANYALSALGGSSSATNREYIITDTVSADVHECDAIFQADWNRTTPTLSDSNLVVSPINSRQKLLSFIGEAKTSLHLEEEEMQDSGFIQALIAAKQRGAQVEVVTPKLSGSDATGAQKLTQASIKITQIDDRSGGGYYIHAKVIVVDGKEAFVGSENASASSLDNNREIGVFVANQQDVQQIDQTIQQDFGG